MPMPRNVRCISLIIAIAAKCDDDRRLSKETSIELNFKEEEYTNAKKLPRKKEKRGEWRRR